MKKKDTIVYMHSDYLNEERNIRIHIPDDDDLTGNVNYPVIYLLDSENYFDLVVEVIGLFSEAGGNGAIQKMIVVGIPNTDRIRDLTPSNDLRPSESSSFPVEDSKYKNSGGAGSFISFIEKEVIPFIDSTYHTSDFRILVGHSFGGLLTLNTMLNHTELFSGYIAIDPSTWWNHQEIVIQAMNIPESKEFRDKALFIANSNSATAYANSIKDPVAKSRFLSRPSFGDEFAARNKGMTDFNWIRYERENHGSIPLIAFYDGLKLMSAVYEKKISGYHKPASSLKESNNDFDDFAIEQNEQNTAPVKKMIADFGDISKDTGKYGDGNSLLRLSNDTTHTSANLFYVMGEILLLKGDKRKALEYFEKSLFLDPENEVVKLKIKKNRSIFKE